MLGTSCAENSTSQDTAATEGGPQDGSRPPKHAYGRPSEMLRACTDQINRQRGVDDDEAQDERKDKQ